MRLLRSGCTSGGVVVCIEAFDDDCGRTKCVVDIGYKIVLRQTRRQKMESIIPEVSMGCLTLLQWQRPRQSSALKKETAIRFGEAGSISWVAPHARCILRFRFPHNEGPMSLSRYVNSAPTTGAMVSFQIVTKLTWQPHLLCSLASYCLVFISGCFKCLTS